MSKTWNPKKTLRESKKKIDTIASVTNSSGSTGESPEEYVTKKL